VLIERMLILTLHILSGNFYDINSRKERFLFVLPERTLPEEVKCKNYMHLWIGCFATN
jgi:hypothetical protein